MAYSGYMSLGHETLVRIGAAFVGVSVLAPLAIVWFVRLSTKGRRRRDH